MRRWPVRYMSGAAGELHARPMAAGRVVEVCQVESPALVLGSTQSASDVDAEAAAVAGVDVVRRRSGGGAVLLLPGRHLWVDVTIGRDDDLWEDDVGRSFLWLGRAWATALDALGVAATAHEGGLVSTPWSRRICFAGVGPGEVQVGGRKVVGLSQRRTRDGARFQCIVHDGWGPDRLLALLALTTDERAAAAEELASVAAGVDAPLDDVLDALLAHLP